MSLGKKVKAILNFSELRKRYNLWGNHEKNTKRIYNFQINTEAGRMPRKELKQNRGKKRDEERKKEWVELTEKWQI